MVAAMIENLAHVPRSSRRSATATGWRT